MLGLQEFCVITCYGVCVCFGPTVKVTPEPCKRRAQRQCSHHGPREPQAKKQTDSNAQGKAEDAKEEEDSVNPIQQLSR